MLAGKKTYIVAGLFIVAVIAKQQGWLTDDSFETIRTVLEGCGLATLRMGMAKK